MATRREAREWIVQLLFEQDLNPSDTDKALTFFWAQNESDKGSREFTERVFRGVREKKEAIDKTIEDSVEHWSIQRMGVVDRNVIRMAVYEILFCDDVPAVVAINEAVDIAKYFSNNESGKFVNGILDHVRKNRLEGDQEKTVA